MAISTARRKSRALAAEITYRTVLATAPCHLTQQEAAEYYNLRHKTPTIYRVIWNHYGTIQPDDDNVVARIKSYKDGICQFLGINDKDIRLRGVDFIRDKATKKTLTFIIE